MDNSLINREKAITKTSLIGILANVLLAVYPNYDITINFDAKYSD